MNARVATGLLLLGSLGMGCDPAPGVDVSLYISEAVAPPLDGVVIKIFGDVQACQRMVVFELDNLVRRRCAFQSDEAEITACQIANGEYFFDQDPLGGGAAFHVPAGDERWVYAEGFAAGGLEEPPAGCSRFSLQVGERAEVTVVLE